MTSRALIVDDETVVREVFRIQLEGWDFEVTACDTRSEAVKLAEVTDFDLVIADASLPDGDGLEILKAVRKRSPRAPVFLTSEDWSPEARATAEKLGGMALYKPCDWQRLQELVSRELDSAGKGQGSKPTE